MSGYENVYFGSGALVQVILSLKRQGLKGLKLENTESSKRETLPAVNMIVIIKAI